MNTALSNVGVPDFVSRLQLLPTVAGYVVLLTNATPTPLIDEIATELEAFADADAQRTILSQGTTARSLLQVLATEKPTGVLVVDATSFVEADWMLLDRQRSDLAREGVTLLITTPESFDLLMRVAPHFASWLGGHVFEWDATAETASPEEIEQRLVALRARSGMTDEDVLAKAKDGTLPRDPEFAEWLVLLGRGELIP